MSNLADKRLERIDALIDKVKLGDRATIEWMSDLMLWALYGPEELSQFGYGLSGWVFRQRQGSTLMTVKVVESGTPLVAFISAATPRGCIEQMFGLLYAERLRWQKDKYPWI